MNIYYAGFFGLLPAVIITVILLIKKRCKAAFRYTASGLAVFCVTAAILLTSGILYNPQEPEIPPDDLLRLCRLYLESGDSTSLPAGFVTADSKAYEHIIKAQPELGTELGPEKTILSLPNFADGSVRRFRYAATNRPRI